MNNFILAILAGIFIALVANFVALIVATLSWLLFGWLVVIAWNGVGFLPIITWGQTWFLFILSSLLIKSKTNNNTDS